MGINFHLTITTVDRYDPQGNEPEDRLEDGKVVFRHEEAEVYLGNWRNLRDIFDLRGDEYCGERKLSGEVLLGKLLALEYDCYMGVTVAIAALHAYLDAGCELECKVTFG